jgi:hypothetical protein
VLRKKAASGTLTMLFRDMASFLLKRKKMPIPWKGWKEKDKKKSQDPVDGSKQKSNRAKNVCSTAKKKEWNP